MLLSTIDFVQWYDHNEWNVESQTNGLKQQIVPLFGWRLQVLAVLTHYVMPLPNSLNYCRISKILISSNDGGVSKN